jgi:hypothetical protein
MMGTGFPLTFWICDINVDRDPAAFTNIGQDSQSLED